MNLNRLSGLVVAVAGAILFFWVIPHHTEPADVGWLKPATLPNITAIMIIITGATHFVFPTGKATFDAAFSLRVGLFFIIGVIGLFLMDLIGFTIAAPLLVLTLMLIIGERRPLWLVSGVVLLPASIWLCVDFLLNRPLP
ncbi:tripartite tricarboxylate transporter TctB family protein [bacterium]|nr:tripartite tricarboxylate transporter TctB family protein [bacterium]